MKHSLAFRTILRPWDILGRLEGWIKGLPGFVEGFKVYSGPADLGLEVSREGN
jgi:hypothetical protein